MKKLISVIITFMLLFSCVGLTVFANPSSATISDDYQKLYLDGNTYIRFNASKLETEYFSSDILVELSDIQRETIDEVVLDTNEELSMILASIYYKDGSVLTAEFLREDYLETYESIATEDVQTYIVNFEYPEDNTIAAKKESLFGKSVTLTAEELEWCDYFPVVIEFENEILTAYMGCLITVDSNYYYVDFEETNINSWYDCLPYEYDELPAYEISDTELIANIEKGMDAYYSDDFGFLLDDSLTETVSLVFLIFVFAVIPFAIFLVFLILAIRSKTVYKKMFRLIYILSAAELAVFAIVTAFITFGR